MDSETVPGGYILLARKMMQSDLMYWPPHYMKLWVWMLLQANYKDRDKLKRGQFVTTIAEMQKAGGYKIGYRFHELTKGEVRSAYEAFVKHSMANTTKTTRGMIITICNYNEYQNPENYEQHSEQHDGEHANNTGTTQDTEEGCKKVKKEIIFTLEDSRTFAQRDYFELLWKAYPKKEDKVTAYKRFCSSVKTDKDADKINAALASYLAMLEESKDWRKPQGGCVWFGKWQGWIMEEHNAESNAA